MNRHGKISLGIVILLIVVTLVGCASVPKEVVELSYIIGEDLEALHLSYRALVLDHFDRIRIQREDFLNNEFIPVFLERFIINGELVESAKGDDPKIVLEDVQDWAEIALEFIEIKRRELIDPIDESERQLLADIDEAFARVMRANVTVTAHLSSLRKVKEIEDDALGRLHLRDLRDRIRNGLVTASEVADNALDKVRKAEGIVDKTEKGKKKIENLLTGDNDNE